MSKQEKRTELIRVFSDIPGIAEIGDSILHDPDHPNPYLRLILMHPLDVDLLPEIKGRVAECVVGGAKPREVEATQ